MRTRVSTKVVAAVILLVMMCVVAFPLYWVLTMSLRPSSDLYEKRIVPSSLTMENFRQILLEKSWAAFESVSFLVPFRNSLVVGVSAVLFSLCISIPAGYGLAKVPMRGKKIVSTYVLLAYVFPPFILIIALYSIAQNLGLRDKLLGLALIHQVRILPYCTWMLRGYFSTVPKELEDSARIDGCSRLGALWRIFLPISAPGVVSAGIFSFTFSWNDLLFTLVTIDNFKRFTVPIALRSMVIGDFVRWNSVMAGVLIAILPPLAFYLLLQRFVVQGLTAGSIK